MTPAADTARPARPSRLRHLARPAWLLLGALSGFGTHEALREPAPEAVKIQARPWLVERVAQDMMRHRQNGTITLGGATNDTITLTTDGTGHPTVEAWADSPRNTCCQAVVGGACGPCP